MSLQGSPVASSGQSAQDDGDPQPTYLVFLWKSDDLTRTEQKQLDKKVQSWDIDTTFVKDPINQVVEVVLHDFGIVSENPLRAKFHRRLFSLLKSKDLTTFLKKHWPERLESLKDKSPEEHHLVVEAYLLVRIAEAYHKDWVSEEEAQEQGNDQNTNNTQGTPGSRGSASEAQSSPSPQSQRRCPWTDDELELLQSQIEANGDNRISWKDIHVPGRSEAAKRDRWMRVRGVR